MATFLTMNVNSLMEKLKSGTIRQQYNQLFRTLRPDVICMQEIKLPAQAKGNKKVKRNDLNPRDRTTISNTIPHNDRQLILSFFSELGYHVTFSLADWKYAGVAMAWRKVDVVNDKVAKDTCLGQPLYVAYNFMDAESYCGLLQHTPAADSSSSDHTTNHHKRNRLMKCHISDNTSSVSDGYTSCCLSDGHMKDGRVIVLVYSQIDVVGTYGRFHIPLNINV